ncbi:hypothetical protein LCGC14_0393880 [marine sediment metagenome]|uniref:DNA (cytosine-5-)-methyltransferase n=1 Tax=marine sediment metagenome TaxID=412755 RepID=A0A0F9W7M3_9ZZZZ
MDEGARLNVLGLCSGIGGIELGLHRTGGFRAVCYVEKNPWCVAVTISRIKDGLLCDAPIWTDLKTFDGKPWRGVVDCIASGFPCQPVSTAGKRLGEEDERWLWPEIIRIICEVRPRIVLLENVPGLLVRGFGRVLGDLAEGGYDAEWDVISAESAGAPHLRERVFIVGYSSELGFGGEYRRGTGTELEDGREEVAHDNSRGCGSERKRRGVEEIRGEGPDLPMAVTKLGQGVAHADAEGFTHIFGGGKAAILAGWRELGSDGWWNAEPLLGRVAHGVPNRVDRLRALGNAVVPQVAEVVGRMILERENRVGLKRRGAYG